MSTASVQAAVLVERMSLDAAKGAAQPAGTASSAGAANGDAVPAQTSAGWNHRQRHSRYVVRQSDIERVRAALPPQESARCSDADIDRYLRATAGDVKHSVKRLQDTLRWRAEERPDLVTCSSCQQDSRSHYLHLVCYDKLQRPVMYSCMAMANNRDMQANKRHMIACFEQAVQLMPAGSEQWVWVCDFHGFGLADCDPRLGKVFLDVSARHYPERLGLFIIIGAPRIFTTLWKALQPFIDPVTKQKIRILPYDAGLASSKKRGVMEDELRLHFDDDTCSWLLAEMAENRDKLVAPVKRYAPETMVPGSRYVAALTPGRHDMRGTPALLAHVAAQPGVMAPFLPPTLLALPAPTPPPAAAHATAPAAMAAHAPPAAASAAL